MDRNEILAMLFYCTVACVITLLVFLGLEKNERVQKLSSRVLFVAKLNKYAPPLTENFFCNVHC